ncbi:hypothetical protein BVX97_05230 [bacterium E08(2017)]|nr:hypothetical protein BVX97_05230 [bacterium E08(2017)]
MRRSLTVFVLLMSMLCVVSIADAGMNKPITLKVGGDIHHFSYEEPGVMEESGLLYGLSGSLETKILSLLFFRAEAAVVAGYLQYVGEVRFADGTTEPLEVDTPNVIANGRCTAGPMLGGDELKVIPYAGLGYRFLIDDLSDPSPQYGYVREQTYIYMPIGVLIQKALNDAWMVELKAEYDVLIDAENYSHDGALGGGVTLPQESGSGFRFAAGFNQVDRIGTLSFEVFAEFWNIDDSETVNFFLEPENESSLFGGRLSIAL